MFIKICGITNPEDAMAAVDAGADAVGLNFVGRSRRLVSLRAAHEIVAVVPAHVMTVGVFENHTISDVLATTERLKLDAAQLHGTETPDMTARVAASVETVIKVVAAGSAEVDSISDHPADIIMIDAPTSGGGIAFDLDLVGDLASRSTLLLAGGLHPGNVAAAIRQVRPWGVDVASGVEDASGLKDASAMRRFVVEARGA